LNSAVAMAKELSRPLLSQFPTGWK
jgi:hypothetical protein